MILKDIIDYDIVNYKEPSMFLIFPTCSFKCCIECGKEICQNIPLLKQPDVEIEVKNVVQRYLDNPLTHAVVCGGLEPFDSWEDLITFIANLRSRCSDVVVIYTGYRNEEIEDKLEILKNYKNIIVKFGRFIPGHEKHYDDILGVQLASLNQYAVKIS